MKSKLIQLSILSLLATAIITAESCKKEDPPAETIPTNTGSTGSGNGNGSGNGSGSGSGNGSTNCSDIDSPNNGNAGACQYAYASGYEITYHPADDNGSNWDVAFGNSVRADLILTIKEQGATSFIFEGAEITNQDPSAPANWAAPSPVKLKNKTYEWELVDYDLTGDDLISSGTFNPITSASNGTITTVAGGSQLIISYTLQ
jgi:hypothetical protein